jgi:hypothetical protein
MASINSYVIVTVVNAIGADKKPTNFFDKASNIMTAALNSIQASMGNQHAKTNIQKQAYPPDFVKTIRSAYGITGTNFGTHSPYINGKRMSLDGVLMNGTEIVLIKNGLNVREALVAASQHQVLPTRTNSIIPSRLGQIQPPLERDVEINYEILGTGEEPGPIFGPGGAGQAGAFGDFGGLGIFGDQAAGSEPGGGVGPGPGSNPVQGQGATGATGATGLQGPQGSQGPQGTAGAQGVQGPAGAVGATGPQGPAGADGTVALQAPIITSVDTKNGIVYFSNPAGMQVEVYRYVRKKAGAHSNKAPKGPYTARIGKRYLPYRQLPNGATSFTVQARWIKGGLPNLRASNRRNYFKLGSRNPSTGDRGDLSIMTITSAVKNETNKGAKIMLFGPGGRANI